MTNSDLVRLNQEQKEQGKSLFANTRNVTAGTITSNTSGNITIATGRPDSVYGSVIVEYKEPGKLSPKKGAARIKAVIDQLKKRFYDMRREEHSQAS